MTTKKSYRKAKTPLTKKKDLTDEEKKLVNLICSIIAKKTFQDHKKYNRIT